MRLQGYRVNEVKDGRDKDGREAGEGAEKEENLEAHPTPCGCAIAAPDGRDKGFAAQDHVEDGELQTRGEIEKDKADEKADRGADDDDGEDGSAEGGRGAGSCGGVGRVEGREGEGAAQQLGEEGDGGDLEEQTGIARIEEEAAGVLPGGSRWRRWQREAACGTSLHKSLPRPVRRGWKMLRGSEATSSRRDRLWGECGSGGGFGMGIVHASCVSSVGCVRA